MKVLTARFQVAGYQVVGADNGFEGLGHIFADKPDLVILDVMMPKMDGWEVLKRLRENESTKNLPVIMLTAKGEIESMRQGERLRATDYFIKPFDSAELFTFVEKCIKTARSLGDQ